MKLLLISAALTATFVIHTSWAADVGISLSVGQPGFYGQLDIGDYPQPALIYPHPRVMYRSAMGRPPIYLRVPSSHARNWRRHCREYNACGEQVYFVQDSWYDREYVPRYQKQHRDRQDEHRDKRHDRQKQDRRDNSHGRER